MAAAAPALREVSLDDKYALESGRVYLTGAQAFVRLLILQRQRDALAGLNTAGFVSGYRGSPLGALDQSLWKAQKFLERAHITFQPGLNEDLAATALWGSQQVNLYPRAKYDGVFGMWYGKGPGVDRCGDVFKHANHAGASKHGGVLVLAGDDHGAKSSTLPHQSDHQFSAAMMPVLYPSSVQEILDLGLHGWAMSRYSGCWVGFKCVADTVETSSSVDIGPDRTPIIVPDDFALPPDGLSIRWPDPFLATEARMQNYKVYAALHYCRVNKLNRIVIDSPAGGKPARLGIITSGKSYLDVRQALADLGITDADAAEIGLRVYKIAMPWPLEPEGVRQFAEGLEEILVVEEKRQVVEYQLKEQLYNWRDDVRPRVVGKFDEKGEWVRPHGDWLLPALAELTPAMIARVIAQRIRRLDLSPRAVEKLNARVDWINAKEAALAKPKIALERIPYFCSGCPHNTSTNVPEGSRATAGIGCHVMAIWMDRSTSTFTHMGGEGVPWIGQAPFTDEKHVFANLGDGTYYHSGSLAIRAAVAAEGQHHLQDPLQRCGRDDRRPAVRRSAHAGRHRAARSRPRASAKIVVVSDDPGKYPAGYFAAGIAIHHRDELDAVQRDAARHARLHGAALRPDLRRREAPAEEARQVPGSAQARRHQRARLRGLRRLRHPVELRVGRAGRDRVRPQAHHRPELVQQGFLVREGLLPELRHRRGRHAAQAGEGRGRRLSRTAGSRARRRPPSPTASWSPASAAPASSRSARSSAWRRTSKARACSVLDMTGLAQKNGAVVSHVRIADAPEQLHSTRIAAGDAKLVLACDILTGVGYEQLAKMQKGVTKALVNTALVMPAGFTRDPDLAFPRGSMEREIEDAVAPGDAEFLDATRLATGLMGDSIATNLFMVGFAFQRGLLPVSEQALMRAIELNGHRHRVEPAEFRLGKARRHRSRARHGRGDSFGETRVAAAVGVARRNRRPPRGLSDRLPGRRLRQALHRFRCPRARRRAGEAARATALAEAVARYYFKLLAVKDEYEVARLYAETDFAARVAAQFEGDYKLTFHLAPPVFNKPDPTTGEAKKSVYGPWMMRAFGVLAKLRRFRGTALDVFGRTAERRMERALIGQYETLIAELLAALAPHNHALAVELAQIPEHIRGFGHVKERHLAAARVKEAELKAAFRAAQPAGAKAIALAAD